MLSSFVLRVRDDGDALSAQQFVKVFHQAFPEAFDDVFYARFV